MVISAARREPRHGWGNVFTRRWPPYGSGDAERPPRARRIAPPVSRPPSSAFNSRTSSSRRPPACNIHTSAFTYSLARYPRPLPGGGNNSSTRRHSPLARANSATPISPARLVSRSSMASSLIGNKVCCNLFIAVHLVGVVFLNPKLLITLQPTRCSAFFVFLQSRLLGQCFDPDLRAGGWLGRKRSTPQSRLAQ